MGWERRLARDEAAEAIDKHGDQAETVLLMKAQQTRSPQRKTIYRLARQVVRRIND